MPTTASTVIAVSIVGPSPGAGTHTADVDDAHAAVRELVVPNRDVGVTSMVPKSRPDTVTPHPAVDTAFSSPKKLTTGAWRIQKQDKTRALLPHCQVLCAIDRVLLLVQRVQS